MTKHLPSQVVLKCDTPNKNGHVYPRAVMEKAIADFVQTLPSVGQFGMPRTDEISVSDVSHKITSVRIENDTVVADVELLDTPTGKLVEAAADPQQQVEAGMKIDFRTCGTGTLCQDENGNLVIGDYTLLSINAVFDGA